LSSNLTTVGTYFCSNLSALTSLTVPAGITSFGNGSFYGNTSMQEYHFLATTPPTLGTNSFRNIPENCIIYVPQGSLSAYQAESSWSSVVSKLQEEA
jgi:hypothetical protein